jgi:hypothetical protein
MMMVPWLLIRRGLINNAVRIAKLESWPAHANSLIEFWDFGSTLFKV